MVEGLAAEVSSCCGTEPGVLRSFLELRVNLSQGRTAGLQLINAGLGPAVITRTFLALDGQPLGKFSETSVNVLRSKLSVRPAAVTFRRTILAAG
jgi:hypothetical protein